MSGKSEQGKGVIKMTVRVLILFFVTNVYF